MSLRVETIAEVSRLEELQDDWDALAVEAAKPFCAPGWLLPWWREAAPAGAVLHVVAAFDGSKLVALAPFFAAGTELRPLGAGATTRVEPLAAEGREAEAAQAIASEVAGMMVLRLPGIPAAAPWPELLAQASGAWLHEDERMPAPVVELDGTFDDWLASRSSRMRNQLRRYERLLAERDARVELATGPEAVPAFAELHRARWRGRGGSGVLGEGVEEATAGAAAELPSTRFRIYSIAAGGESVAAAVFVTAGGESASWLGGFDDRWRDVSPQLLLGVAAIRDSYARAERRVDFGAGAYEYKLRLANAEETLRWATLVLPGRGHLRARASLLPAHLRHGLSQRLSDDQKRRVKRLLGRPS